MLAAAIDVEPGTFLAVMAASAVGGTAAALVTGRGLLVPTVVVELLLGVLIGPEILGLDPNEFVSFFADLGLGMLFFFAGYEIDLHRITGTPLRLALLGWAMSLVLTYMRSASSRRISGSTCSSADSPPGSSPARCSRSARSRGLTPSSRASRSACSRRSSSS